MEGVFFLREATLKRLRENRLSPPRQEQARRALYDVTAALKRKPCLTARLLYGHGLKEKDVRRLLSAEESTLRPALDSFRRAWINETPRYRTNKQGRLKKLTDGRTLGKAAPSLARADLKRFGRVLGRFPPAARKLLLFRYRNNMTWRDAAKKAGFSLSGAMKINRRFLDAL